MKSEIKKIDGTKREVSVEITGDTVKNKFEDVLSKISKEAKVPGFRPGNAPRDIIERNFSSLAHEQVLKELVPEVYNQVIEKEKLDVVELPEIFDVKLDRSSLSFKAKVEVVPEIALKNYKGLKVRYNRLEVSEDEIKRSLDSIKESRKIDTLDDKVSKGFGYPTMADFKGAIERQMLIQKENQQRAKIEQDIIGQLTKDLDFKVPQVMVNRQLQDLLRQYKLDLALKGMPKEKLEKEEPNLIKELEPQAASQVKVYLILAEIARKENIPVDEHVSGHVIEFLLKEANWSEAA